MNAPSSFFLDKKRKTNISVIPVTTATFESWLKSAPPSAKVSADEKAYTGQPGKILILQGEKGGLCSIVTALSSPISIYDLAPLVTLLRQTYSEKFLKSASFTLDTDTLNKAEITNLFIGWALACYEFSAYKKPSRKTPALAWDKKADKARVKSFVESIFLVRDLVTTPSNNMGPAEIEAAAKKIATKHEATFTAIRDKDLLKKNFPLIYAVGDGSPRRPRLIEFTWGNPKHPKLTLVGKGVAFDTGGLNLKPTGNMALMKKDMGGAAHVLALSNLIMTHRLKVRLRVLIAAVENAVDGYSFRPGDIFKGRNGLTIENTNTDAEGRLILSDALSYACEDKPQMLIDYATLTGSARAALGPDIPAMFSNNEKIADQLKKISFEGEDPLWPMPLWQPYQVHNNSTVADMQNSSGVPGDLMYSALFLQRFLTGKPDWVHIDTYAWEHIGKPGRPRGGADFGMRSVFAFLEGKYK